MKNYRKTYSAFLFCPMAKVMIILFIVIYPYLHIVYITYVGLIYVSAKKLIIFYFHYHSVVLK
jgi:hypothetical protein